MEQLSHFPFPDEPQLYIWLPKLFSSKPLLKGKNKTKQYAHVCAFLSQFSGSDGPVPQTQELGVVVVGLGNVPVGEGNRTQL